MLIMIKLIMGHQLIEYRFETVGTRVVAMRLIKGPRHAIDLYAFREAINAPGTQGQSR